MYTLPENIEIVNILLMHNADVYVKDDNGKIPLHIAAGKGNDKIIELLLKYDKNFEVSSKFSTLHTIDEDYATPFHEVCKGKNMNCIQYLLECGVDVSVETLHGETPLHFACQVGNFNTVKLLIEKGAPLDIVDYKGNTALHNAVKNCHSDIVELLLKNKANTIIANKCKKIPLHHALTPLNEKCLELLLSYTPNINSDEYEKVFCDALKIPDKNHWEKVTIFFKHGFKVNDKNNFDVINLFDAIVKGSLDAVEEMLGQIGNAKTTIAGQTALHVAAACCQCDVIKLLLEHEADVHVKNLCGWIPVYYAFRVGDWPTIEAFLGLAMLDMNQRPEVIQYPTIIFSELNNESGITEHNYVKVMERLIQLGGDLNYQDSEHGYSILHLILRYLSKYKEKRKARYLAPIRVPRALFEYLLSKEQVQVNLRSKGSGESALHLSVLADYFDLEYSMSIVDQLLDDRHAYIDCQNALDGDTPLHMACRQLPEDPASVLLIIKLLNYGADIDLENAAGRLALDELPCSIEYHSKNYRALGPRFFAELRLLLCGQLNEARLYDDILLVGYRHFDSLMNAVDEGYSIVGTNYSSFQERVLRLRAAEAPIHPRNADFPYSCCPESLQKVCRLELAFLEQLRFGARLSLRDFLTKEPRLILRSATSEETNQVVRQIFRQSHLLPIYWRLVMRRYARAVSRAHLVDAAKPSLNQILGIYLPDICVERIFHYLDDFHLQCLSQKL